MVDRNGGRSELRVVYRKQLRWTIDVGHMEYSIESNQLSAQLLKTYANWFLVSVKRTDFPTNLLHPGFFHYS